MYSFHQTSPSPQEFIERCINREYYYPTIPNEINATGKKNIPLPLFYKPTESKLVCVLGENGSGKSFFKRITKIVCDAIRSDFVEVSPEEKCKNDKEEPKPFYHYNYIKKVNYGKETCYPTSFNTVNSVISALDICKDKYVENYVFLDNPELGLTDNYACTMGMHIAKFIEKIPKNTKMVLVSTNSKVLITELEYLNPHFIYFGENNDHPKSIEEWLNEMIKPISFSNLIIRTETKLNRLKSLIDKK